jgi:aminopeptidase
MAGEIALVSHNTPISLSNVLFYNTLFDENASCHIALGKAYPTCISDSEGKTVEELKLRGVNDSAIHVDFMFGTSDLSVIGIKDGIEVIIFDNGNFV